MKAFSRTDVGVKRQVNQDYVFCSEEGVGNLPNLFIVADGMGGHNAGDYASSFATNFVVEEIRSSDEKNPIKLIRSAIEKANEKLLEDASSHPDKDGMGTTFVAATVMEDGYLYVANVGDSRLYLVSEGLTQITRDHSLVEEMVRAGKLDKEAARLHPDKNIITRAVGAVRNLKVDFFDMKLKSGDRFFMCTDGLSNMVSEAGINEVLDEDRSIEATVNALVDKANECGGKDNIAVILVDPFA
ncbi:MAG: Stp1/IreP family PP2C-type Ser/Thr phosphatase [Lachnospiraceae bacterium]|nr:Stp1/IreP family PP2C-type Ser/Thr phosphatase [Lachnospiraceae bacterium]